MEEAQMILEKHKKQQRSFKLNISNLNTVQTEMDIKRYG